MRRLARRLAGGFLAIGLLLGMLSGCATVTPTFNRGLVTSATALKASTDVMTDQVVRGAKTKSQGLAFDAALDEPVSALLAMRAALIGCPAPCDAYNLHRDDLRRMMLELERKLREEKAAEETKARSRDVVTSRGALEILTAINNALALIEAAKDVQMALADRDATDADVDTAFKRLDAARETLRKASAS